MDLGKKILCLGFIVSSDSNKIRPYQSYYCLLDTKRNGELKYSRFSMMPYVNNDGSAIEDPTALGNTKNNSNIVAGNILLVDGYLYWCYYNSVRNVQLLRWKTKRNRTPKRENIEVLANIGDGNKNYCYSEVGAFYDDGCIYLSLRDEKANNSNWKYVIKTGVLSHIGNTTTRAFGPHIYKPKEGPALLTGRQYTYLKDEAQITRMDNLILLSSKGGILKENIGFVGHPMGVDSMYCSIIELDGTIFVFYYYGVNCSRVSPDSRYTIAYKTIRVEDLQKLLD